MNPFYKSEAGEEAVLQLYERMLARWPVPVTSSRVPTRHGETHVLSNGSPSSPPLLLLHGSCSNALSWMGEVETFSGHFRVHAVDLPAEPGRSEAVRPSWSDHSFVEWMEDLLAGLRIERASFVGISLGAWAILRFATLRREQVAAAALLAPSGVAPAKTWGLFKIVALSMLGRRGRHRINQLIWGKDKMPDEAVEYMDVIGAHFKPRMGSPALFTDQELQGLDLPLLVLQGKQDILLRPEATVSRLQRLLPRAEVRLLEDQAHAIHGVSREILEFLRASTPS